MNANVKNLVIVNLRNGDASDARSALAVDLDPGSVAWHWSALVDRDLVAQLAEETGAEIDGDPEAWDGSRFGDGAGTVEIIDGRLVGTGAYARLNE